MINNFDEFVKGLNSENTSESKNPNLKLVGTQQKMLTITGPNNLEAEVFEIDLDEFLKAEGLKKEDIKIKNNGTDEYYDTF